MEPSEVRKRVLRDHASLRATVDEVESLARDVLEGTSGLRRQLSDLGEKLLRSLETHMTWEDEHLAPVLRDADAWGEELEALMRREHVEQRQVLRYLLEKLRDTKRPIKVLARNLVDFSAMLRDDMADEEETLLDPDVLQDDADGIGLEAG